MDQNLVIKEISGRAVSVRGNDIDTDRIIPARFLKCVVFEGLEKHVFEDDRRQLAQKGEVHPFDQDRFQGAEILFVNKNFGCGSSREHAPQSLARWGIKAIIGESFSEIFFSNNIAMGVPCLHARPEDMERLIALNENQPETVFKIDLVSLSVTNGLLTLPVTLADSSRESFLSGSWDVTAELLSNSNLIEATAAKLPYFNHWK